MISRIYRGHVMHARLEPVRHVFSYPAWFFAFDLDELPRLSNALFGYNRQRLLSLRDRDYLDRGPGSIRQKLMRYLSAQGCADGVARVELLTSARFLGHAFNPVSFYYCYRADGTLRCAVAEVSNTFKERHLYVLPDPAHAVAEKEFHVSPFNNVEGHYEFEFSPAGPALDIRIDLWRDGREIIKTQLAGDAFPFTTSHLLKSVFHPLSSVFLTLPRIHWQAARLFFQKKLRVFHKPIPRSDMTIRSAPPTLGQRLSMRLVLPYLEKIRSGHLTLTFPDQTTREYGIANDGLRVSVLVKDWQYFWRILKDGDIGFGESYMHGEWDTDDLPGLIQLFLLNRHVFESQAGTARIGLAINRLGHLLRPNTLWGSRKNISAHYDLSNDLYRMFLDPSMMYSCAIYHDPHETLEQAQKNKLHALIHKANITKDDHVLEIGSGWGAFAIEAVKLTGCRVKTITISTQQLALARQRVAEAGLQDRITVELCDYRHLTGTYDKIISIEMLEAVGHQFLGEFFNVCDRLLNPGGLMALQVITMPDERYETYRNGVDWIQKHIFPGGHLPSLGALREAMHRSSQFAIAHVEDIGLHYAPTLREWRGRFLSARDRVRALGFDDEFVRKWVYYFSYCEAAFATRAISNHHLVLTRATR